MARVKRGVQAKARHKKVLKQAKGFRGARSRTYKVAKQAVMKAGQYAYRDRRQKKRVFRVLWIARINAGAREFGLTYSRFIAFKRLISVRENDWSRLLNLESGTLISTWSDLRSRMTSPPSMPTRRAST